MINRFNSSSSSSKHRGNNSSSRLRDSSANNNNSSLSLVKTKEDFPNKAFLLRLNSFSKEGFNSSKEDSSSNLEDFSSNPEDFSSSKEDFSSSRKEDFSSKGDFSSSKEDSSSKEEFPNKEDSPSRMYNVYNNNSHSSLSNSYHPDLKFSSILTLTMARGRKATDVSRWSCLTRLSPALPGTS